MFPVLVIAAVAGIFGMSSSVKAEEDGQAVIADRVYIGEVSVAGMTAQEAEAAVNDQLKDLKKTSVDLKAGEKSLTVQAGELGIDWGNREIVEKAVNLGRTGNPIARYKEKKDLEKGDKVFHISYTIDAQKTESLLKEHAAELEQEAQDNGLTREDGKFVFVKGQEGVKLKIGKSVNMITAYMRDEWDGKAADIALDAEIVEPQGSEEELAKVKDILGSYSTTFGTSGSGRIANIRRGAELINGSIIYPGEEFSVNVATSPFTAENGYELAGSYENGTTVDSYGGGICQVSTTLYNAVIRAELEVTERSAHSMIVTYVEPSMDAAISGEYKDLKFKNSTKAPVYIEGYTEGGVIYFNLYGEETRDPNREVSFVSETMGETDPGVQFVPDETLPIGTLSTQQQAHVGKRARLWKIVKVNGVEQSREEFNTSSYRASPKIVKVGTASANPEAVAAINAAIGTQDETIIQVTAVDNCDEAIAARQAQQAAEAAAAEAAAAAQQEAEKQAQEAEKNDGKKNSGGEKDAGTP